MGFTPQNSTEMTSQLIMGILVNNLFFQKAAGGHLVFSIFDQNDMLLFMGYSQKMRRK